MDTQPAFSVVRHGGRRTHEWRTLHAGNSLTEAQQVYHKHLMEIRCGSLALIENGNGRALQLETSGNNRSRW